MMSEHWATDQIWTWENARKPYRQLTASPTEECYRVAEKPQILPYPDKMPLPTVLADELHDFGEVSLPVDERTVPLPVFEVNMWVDAGSDDSRIAKLLQPEKPYREDMWVYGFDCLFVLNKVITDTRHYSNYVTCMLTLYDSNDSSAGVNDVAIFTFVDKGEHFIKILPYWRDPDMVHLCDDLQLEKLALWLGFLWRGIQLRLLNRPELVRERHTRIPKADMDSAKKEAPKTARVVKVVREITLLSENIKPEETTSYEPKRTIDLDCWGVTGHWRVYKTGKRVWIAPYRKGKERHNNSTYSAKEYQIVQEVR